MGIKGLVPFIKKTRPDLIKQIPARWLSPEIRGKTVAIDGPLLTSRFFFAGAGGGQELEEKRMIIGWHALITTMRKAGVTPLTVWDVKGDRPWKRKEHMRRDAVRQLAMSRLLHEDRRQERLERLMSVLKDAVEPKASVHAEQVEDAARAEQVVPIEQIGDAGQTERIGPAEQEEATPEKLVEDLRGLIKEVQLSSRPSLRRGRKELAASLEETEDAELMADDIDSGMGLDTSLTEEGSLALTDEQDPSEELEIKRALVEPDTIYTESPRQMTLTAEEELQLQDLVQATSSSDGVQSRIAEIGKEVADIRDRSQVVSRTYRRGHSIPTKWELEECQNLMEVMGVPVIHAHPPYEAEGLASVMALEGMADFVGTEDTDVLGYEAPLLRNIASSNKPIEIVEGKALRPAYDLTREQFVDFLVLTGTDASSRIPGVGPVKALKLIQQFGTIEAILDNDERIRGLVSADYHQEVEAARRLFNDLPPLPSAEELQPREVKDEIVRQFMKNEHGVLWPAGKARSKETSIEADPQSQYRLAQNAELAHEAFLQHSASLEALD